jgi:hypothetical protein
MSIPSHSIEILEWFDNCASNSPVKFELPQSIPSELVDMMNLFWGTLKTKDLSKYKLFDELRRQYELVNRLQSIYFDEYQLGKLTYSVHYIATCFCDKVKEEMINAENALTQKYPSSYRKWMNFDLHGEEEEE